MVVGAAAVVDFLEVGEVVLAAVEVQEGDFWEVGAAEVFEGANLEAEAGTEDEADFVDHSTENYNTYTRLHIFISKPGSWKVQRPNDCSAVEVARNLSARSL